MKKFYLLLIGLLISANLYSQNVEEPDFVGECIALKPDNSSVLLEKTTSQIRTAAGASLFIVGIGSVKSKIQIDGCCAKTRFKSSEPIKIIVKAVDNNTDPLAIIHIFAFDSNKKYRRAEVASVNSFGTSKTNKLKYIPFTAKKYKTNSYILTLQEQPVGEYGITVSNPNNLDEKSTVISTFAFE